MKKSWIKFVPIFLYVIILFLSYNGGSNMSVFGSNKNIEDSIEKIIHDNEDKKVTVNKTIDNKFVYLEFENEDKVFSYFVNVQTGQSVDFLSFIKEEERSNFLNKINELLYLKYPKFIADVLSADSVEKTYQIKDNELVIYYDHYTIEPSMNEKLFLVVNYNEIKDYLDFTFLLSADYQNEDGYNFSKDKKTVALTFDDGPGGAKTNEIVNLLAENKAHATFFMVGNKMENGASVIHNVLKNGNEIGSHSYDHKNMKRQKTEDILTKEEQTKTIYHDITGEDFIYTRPPYGSINNSIKENLDTIFITWNLDTEDWLHRDKNYIVDYVMNNISDGDIILMHDLYDSTVDAVRELLPKLYAEGYQVVSISELASLHDRTLEPHTIYRSIKRNSE